MKKVVLFIFFILLITSCTNNVLKEERTDYFNYIKLLETNEKYDTELPCDILVNLDKYLNDEIVFRVIIDNPKEEIKDIEVLVIHNHKTNDIYPSSGIFEEKLSLIPGNIDLEKGNAKGIILTGYIDSDKDISEFKAEFKILIKYIDKNNEEQTIYYKYIN